MNDNQSFWPNRKKGAGHLQRLCKAASCAAVLFGLSFSAWAESEKERVVVLTFDDAVLSHYTFVAPLLKDYGFGATFFISEHPNPAFTERKDLYMTWEQIQSLSDMGFEIGNHTQTHAHVNKIRPDQQREELTYIEKQCAERGIPKPTSFAYPGYDTHPSALQTLKQMGYRFARAGGSRPYRPGSDDPLLIPSFSTTGSDKARVLGAIQQAGDGKLVVLTIHGVPDLAHPQVTTPPELFKEYLDYMHENNYTVIALRDLERYAESAQGRLAPKPLFRDPIHDGAADPVLCWNRQEQKWLMYYTNRRANVEGLRGVSWVHGTQIGVAESADGGATWHYRGTATIPYGDGEYSYWAPEVLYHAGAYHMYLSFVPGMHEDWGGTRRILHLTSQDGINWKHESDLNLASNRVIDACVTRLPNGSWRMWYNNEVDRKSMYIADSPDLFHWTQGGKAIGDQAGEGAKVFIWKGRYWMVVDTWDGLAVYSSNDCEQWTRQNENILRKPGAGLDDQVKGGHPDVVVSGDRAFLFYFTHPGRRGPRANEDRYETRRSSIQVVELEYADGVITCDRDRSTHIQLQPPKEDSGKKE